MFYCIVMYLLETDPDIRQIQQIFTGDGARRRLQKEVCERSQVLVPHIVAQAEIASSC